MTDRHSAYIVVLAKDIREDDALATIEALKMIKGVISVKPHVGRAFEAAIARERADHEWRQRVADLLMETKP